MAVSLLNPNYAGKVPVDSPTSVEACRRIGVEPSELVLQDIDDSTPPFTKAQVEFWNSTKTRLIHEAREVCRQIMKEAQRSAMRQENAKGGTSSPSPSPPRASDVQCDSHRKRQLVNILNHELHTSFWANERQKRVERVQVTKADHLRQVTQAARNANLEMHSKTARKREQLRGEWEEKVQRRQQRLREKADRLLSHVARTQEELSHSRMDASLRAEAAKLRVAHKKAALQHQHDEAIAQHEKTALARAASAERARQAKLETAKLKALNHRLKQEAAVAARARNRKVAALKSHRLAERLQKCEAAHTAWEEKRESTKADIAQRQLREVDKRDLDNELVAQVAAEIRKDPNRIPPAVRKLGLRESDLTIPKPPAPRKGSWRPFTPRPPPPPPWEDKEESIDDTLRRLGLHEEQQADRARARTGSSRYWAKWIYQDD